MSDFKIRPASERRLAEEAMVAAKYQRLVNIALQKVDSESEPMPIGFDVQYWPLKYKQLFAQHLLEAGYAVYQTTDLSKESFSSDTVGDATTRIRVDYE